MKKTTAFFPVLFLCGILLLLSKPVLSQTDAEGSKDPALFTRMPGYHIYRYDDLQFDQYEFKISSEKTQVVEGHSLFIIYDLNDNIEAPSPLQIGRNYINAAKSVGGQLVYEFHDPGEDVVVKVVKNNMETSLHYSQRKRILFHSPDRKTVYEPGCGGRCLFHG